MLSGRSLMYSRKSVGPKMEPWGTPVLTGYFCEDFLSRSTRSCLLLRKEEIKPNIWPEIPQDLSLWRRQTCQTLSNPACHHHWHSQTDFSDQSINFWPHNAAPRVEYHFQLPFFVGQLVLLKENYPGNELEAGTLTKYTDISFHLIFISWSSVFLFSLKITNPVFCI